MIADYLEQHVVRWLVNRGYLVIKQPFIGLCVGYATVNRLSNSPTHDAYMVVIPKDSRVIALNNSVITGHGGSGAA